ncbi:hypothetical protein BJX68DRAFT_2771 [Aspergillus pseudodeflectus]|uniref:Secreted protein n=1 Tax=Aspergillus pseudodeflectus TaxID=176178 RepID=A0ABR4L9Z2_9EURO
MSPLKQGGALLCCYCCYCCRGLLADAGEGSMPSDWRVRPGIEALLSSGTCCLRTLDIVYRSARKKKNSKSPKSSRLLPTVQNDLPHCHCPHNPLACQPPPQNRETSPTPHMRLHQNGCGWSHGFSVASACPGYPFRRIGLVGFGIRVCCNSEASCNGGMPR